MSFTRPIEFILRNEIFREVFIQIYFAISLIIIAQSLLRVQLELLSEVILLQIGRVR